jgi:hypothetical protein
MLHLETGSIITPVGILADEKFYTANNIKPIVHWFAQIIANILDILRYYSLTYTDDTPK